MPEYLKNGKVSQRIRELDLSPDARKRYASHFETVPETKPEIDECMLCGTEMKDKEVPLHNCPHGRVCTTISDYCPKCKATLPERLQRNSKTKATLEFWREIYACIDEVT